MTVTDVAGHLQRLAGLYNQPQFSDVRLISEDRHQFHCHKAILAAVSGPFKDAVATQGEHPLLWPEKASRASHG